MGMPYWEALNELNDLEFCDFFQVSIGSNISHIP